MLVLLLGIVDLARIYTTMLSVESAAREAADYGTTLGAEKWQAGEPMNGTVQEMKVRACVAARNLTDFDDPDYVDPAVRANPDLDPDKSNCTNPSFDYCVVSSSGGTCAPVDPAAGCDNPLRDPPCVVKVTLSFDFKLLAPLNFEFMGVRYGLPSTLSFDRDSYFAMTDIDLTPAAPGS